MARNRQAGRGKSFRYPVHIENQFASKLRGIARNSGRIVLAHVGEDGITIDHHQLTSKSEAYAKQVEAWANHYVPHILKKVLDRNIKDFVEFGMTKSAPNQFSVVSPSASSFPAHTKHSRRIRDLLKTSNHTERVSVLTRAQVLLIRSLPIEAAQRAQRLAHEAVVNGERASEIRDEIARSGDVSESRANLIARTEIAKANAAFTQANAKFVGSTHYYWRTAEDEAVRESHADVDGKIFEFDEPPTLSDGMTGNAGEFPNCRCYAEPIIDDGE